MSENGQIEGPQSIEADALSERDALQQVRSERDAYARAAQIAESNELQLHRMLSPYLDAESERKDAEIARLQRRAGELEGNDGRS